MLHRHIGLNSESCVQNLSSRILKKDCSLKNVGVAEGSSWLQKITESAATKADFLTENIGLKCITEFLMHSHPFFRISSKSSTVVSVPVQIYDSRRFGHGFVRPFWSFR